MKLPRLCVLLDTGRLECRGSDLDEHAARELAELLQAGPGQSTARAVEFRGERAWLKHSPLRGRARLRHALRGLVGMPLPRVREHRNLAWLGERLFHVPTPLASGCLRGPDRSLTQFLVTRRLEEVVPLDQVLPDAPPQLRTALVRELAHEVARMHALHFIHHDLFVRNVLVGPASPAHRDQRRLVFIDAWRGGPDYLPRGADYDLACLMLEGAALFTPSEQALFFQEYLAESAAQGRTPNRPRLLGAIVRERARLMSRIDREPTRWRGPGAPVTDWQPPRD